MIASGSGCRDRIPRRECACPKNAVMNRRICRSLCRVVRCETPARLSADVYKSSRSLSGIAPSKQESTTYEPSLVCKLLILGCRLLIPDRLLGVNDFASHR